MHRPVFLGLAYAFYAPIVNTTRKPRQSSALAADEAVEVLYAQAPSVTLEGFDGSGYLPASASFVAWLAFGTPQ